MATITWKTATSGSWTTSANWSGGVTPGPADDVIIGGTGTYTVSAAGSISARSITLSDANATLAPTNTLALGNTMTLSAGTFVFNGTTIKGGTIALAGGSFQVNTGTLNGVDMLGTLNLAGNAASITVVGNLDLFNAAGTGPGTVNLTGTSSVLAFAGTQTLDAATINFGSTVQASPAKLQEKDLPGTGATLTLGPALTVRASGGYGMIQATDTAANDALVNAGTIAFGTGGGVIELSANQFTNTGKMTVTAGGSLHILTGPYGVAGGEIGSNSGSISLSSGLLAFGSTFSNSGSIVATGGTLTIGGTFSTTGFFQVNNTKVTIGGTVSGASVLALLNNSSDTVSYSATYENAGAVLNIGSGTTIGTLTLNSTLPIRNGVIADAGGGFVYSGGTLTNVTYQGTMDLSRNGASVVIATKLVSRSADGTGPGTIKLSGTSSALTLVNSQTLDGTTILLGSSARTAFAKVTERDSAGTGTTLTLGSSLQILSNGGFGLVSSVGTASADALVNKGTVQVASTGGLIELSANQFTNTGKLLVSAGGTLAILSGPYSVPAGAAGSNVGTISSTGGNLMLGGSFVNTGSMTVNGGTLTTSGSFDNLGNLAISNATVNLGGVFGGQVFLRILNDASDTVTVTGTYDNSGDTLYVGSGTTLGTINLANGLPISGGTIVDSGGGMIFAGGTLDGVTYVGTIALGAGAALDLMDGITVRSGAGAGIVNVTGGYAQLNFLNAQTIDNLQIGIGDASETTDSLYNYSSGTVTLGAGVSLQQATGVAQIYSYAGSTTVNQGTIGVGGDGVMQLYGNGGSFVNAGSILVNGGTLLASAFLGSSSFSNTGTLSVTGSGSATLEVGWDNTGAISVSNGGTLQLGSDNSSSWGTIGSITASNATLQLGGAFTTWQLRQLSLSATDTQIFGDLDNTGCVLPVGGDPSRLQLTLNGGTISGGTISDAGGGVVFNDGTLDGATYRGALTVATGGSLWIENGLSLIPVSGSGGGTLNLTGGGSGLFVLDSETLDNATISIGDASGDTDYIESYSYPSAGTLTLGSGLLIQQSTGDAAIYSANGGRTVNAGSIAISGGLFHVDVGSFVNAGTISVSGATAMFDDNVAGFTNTGLIAATGSGAIALQAGWNNDGTISVGAGGMLQLGSDSGTAWGRIGSISASSATLNLYGAFTSSQLLQIGLVNDTVNVAGVLTNTGTTLAVAGGAGIAALGPLAGGVIKGGVIADAGGGLIAGGGTLDGVTYRGALAIGAAGSLNIRNGLTLQSLSGGSPGTLALSGGGSSLVVLDSETLNNAGITIGDASQATDVLSNGGANGTTLTLGAGVTLRQTVGQAQILNTGSADFTVNQGTIAVGGGTLDISGGTFSNLGTISATGGGLVVFEPGSLGNYNAGSLSGGSFVAGAGSTIQLARSSTVSTLAADVTEVGSTAAFQWLNSGGAQVALDSTVRTIAVGGALRLLSGRSLTVPGTFLDQGLLQLAGGTLTTSSTLTVSGTLQGYGTLAGGLADTGLVEATGGLLTVVNITSGNGQLQVDADGSLELVTNSALGVTLAGSGGTLILDKPSTYTGTIASFGLGDSIVLGGVTASSASILSNVLTVNLSNGGTLSYGVSGSFTGLLVRTALVGGNTVVTLGSAAPSQITGLLNNTGLTLVTGGGGTTYDLAGGIVQGGTIADAGGGFVIGYGTLDGVTYRGTLAVGAGGSLSIADGLVTRPYSGGGAGSITLTAGGSVLSVLDTETLDNAVLAIGDATGNTDILANGGANGTTLTLGAGLNLQQTTGQAQILGTGSADLTVNRGQIAVSGGTLDISGGSFSNLGTIAVSGGGTVLFETGTLANFAGNTLTGGVWSVGSGSTLQLPRSSFVYNLAADLSLVGNTAVMQSLNSSNVQVATDTSLKTINATGVLRLLAGRSLALRGAFADQGTIQLAGGTLSNSATTTVSGSVYGFGTLSGGVADSGVIEAKGGRLNIVNIATGTGRLQIDSDGTLELTTTCALSSGFSGSGGTLQLDKPTTYSGTIGGFALGDTIVLGGVTATSASITSGTLTVNLTGGKTVSYGVTGSFAGLSVQTANSGGNAQVTLSAGSALARAAVLPLGTAIDHSTLSLASAGFLDSAGRLSGHLVSAHAGAETLAGTAGVRDVFSGSVAALDGDTLAGFGVGADLVALTDLSFAAATVRADSGAAHTTIRVSDGVHAGSFTLGAPVSASHLMLLADGHGGSVLAQH